MRMPGPRLLRAAVLAGTISLLPTVAWSKPTSPPPAPRQKLGEVKVVEETRGTRTVVDSAGRVHLLMKHVTPEQRKAAALRARATREAAAKRHNHPTPAAK